MILRRRQLTLKEGPTSQSYDAIADGRVINRPLNPTVEESAQVDNPLAIHPPRQQG